MQKDQKKFSFTDSPYMDYVHKLIISEEDDLSIAEALSTNRNHTKKFLDDIKYRILNDKNFIFSLWGFTGIGKSTTAQFLGNYAHSFIMSSYCRPLVEKIEEKWGRKPVFDVTNVCFDTSELLKRIKEGVPLETYIYDEAGTEKIVGTGSMREKIDKERIMKRVRLFQQNFIFCDPIEEDTKLSRLHLYKLQSFDIDKKNKLNRTIIHAVNGDDYYSPYGHIITKFIELDGYIAKKTGKAKEIEQFLFGGGRLKVWQDLAKLAVEKGILKYKYGDWPFLIDGWTNQNYTKDEIKAVIRLIRFDSAEIKENKEKKPKE